jgi:hypothetical protein
MLQIDPEAPAKLLAEVISDPDGQWLVRARSALVDLGAGGDENLQQAAQYWMAALGAWIQVTEDASRAGLAEKAMQFFALGLDHWLAASENSCDAALRATKDPLALDTLKSLGSLCRDARLAMRGDEAASHSLTKHGEDVERSLTAMRLGG